LARALLKKVIAASNGRMVGHQQIIDDGVAIPQLGLITSS
jgi:hypothetical protein